MNSEGLRGIPRLLSFSAPPSSFRLLLDPECYSATPTSGDAARRMGVPSGKSSGKFELEKALSYERTVLRALSVRCLQSGAEKDAGNRAETAPAFCPSEIRDRQAVGVGSGPEAQRTSAQSSHDCASTSAHVDMLSQARWRRLAVNCSGTTGADRWLPISSRMITISLLRTGPAPTPSFPPA